MTQFETGDVARMVGIRPIYLNRFVERKLYGIQPSARSGEGTGRRRWFSFDDLLGIALVWWLFEAGLRTEVIKRVLRELGNSKVAIANQAAKSLRKSGAEVLIISRKLRLGQSTQPRTPQSIVATDYATIRQMLKKVDGKSLQVLPVRTLFATVISQVPNIT
ncbi:MAG: hypothetical protein ACLP3K_11390 [Candidatus Acidiferrales bacterium]